MVALVLALSGLWFARPSLAAGPPPVITIQPLDQQVMDGNPVTFTVAATSSTTLSYQWFQDGLSNGLPFLYKKLTSQTNSTLTLPNVSSPDEGLYYVEVQNSGGTVTSRKATLTVVPNNGPVASNDVFTTLEDVPVIVAAPGVLANDKSTNGLVLGALLVNNVAHGSLSLAADGSFSYTPATNYNGSDSFTYRATDGGTTGNVATVTIAVTPVNDPPIAVNDIANVNEDANVNISVLANDSDPEGAALLVTGVTTTNGTVAIVNTGSKVQYKPSTNYNGTVVLSYTVSDGTNFSTAFVTVTVKPKNDAPVASNDIYTTTEDVPLNVSHYAGILANDVDVDGDTLTALLVTNVTRGTLSLNANGSFIYTPGANYYGSDSFAYRPKDGTVTGNVATVTINITAANDQPVAGPDAYTTPEDVPLIVSAPGVLTNDTDVEGGPLTALLVSNVSYGTLRLNPDGSFTYLPKTNYNGTDTFTYRVSDGAPRVPTLLQESLSTGDTMEIRPDKSGAQSFRHGSAGEPAFTISKVRLRLSRKSDAPNTDLNFSIGRGINSDPIPGSSYAITMASITNTSDASSFQDYDIVFAAPVGPFTAGTTYYLNLDNAPNGRDVHVQTSGNNTYANGTYYEEGDDQGEDMRFQIFTDNNSDTATVTITVTPVNDAPVANPDSFTLPGNTSFTVSDHSVLSNDTDADNDPLMATLVSGAAHGSLALHPDGTFTYTPTNNYFGTDSFTYRVSDGGPGALPLADGFASFVTPDLGVTTVLLTIVNPNPIPISIGAGVMTPAGLELSLAGPASGTYVIEASTNLTDWTAISTNSGVTGSVVFTDTTAASYSRRFYRAVAR